MNMKLGKLNKCNPDKITSNTHVQNPTQMTAQYLYKKNFSELTNEQKVAVYRFLTPIHTDSKGRPAVPSKGMSQEIIDEIYGKDSHITKSLGSQLDQRDNSPEFKQLTYLHPKERTLSYIHQDNKDSFRSQPKYGYNKNVNLKLMREKLISSPHKESPTGERQVLSPRHSINSNIDGYFLNLRKQSNNTELNSPDRASIGTSLQQSIHNNNTDKNFTRVIQQGFELNQSKYGEITQKKNQRRNLLFSKYDYNSPGSFELAYRVPDNLIGDQLKKANIVTQQINIELMPEQVARKSKKTDGYCLDSDFKSDTFRKLYPGPFAPSQRNQSTHQHFNTIQQQAAGKVFSSANLQCEANNSVAGSLRHQENPSTVKYSLDASKALESGGQLAP